MKTIKHLFSIILFLSLTTSFANRGGAKYFVKGIKSSTNTIIENSDKASKSLRSFFIRYYFFNSSTVLPKLLDDSSVQLSSIEVETKKNDNFIYMIRRQYSQFDTAQLQATNNKIKLAVESLKEQYDLLRNAVRTRKRRTVLNHYRKIRSILKSIKQDATELSKKVEALLPVFYTVKFVVKSKLGAINKINQFSAVNTVTGQSYLSGSDRVFEALPAGTYKFKGIETAEGYFTNTEVVTLSNKIVNDNGEIIVYLKLLLLE